MLHRSSGLVTVVSPGLGVAVCADQSGEDQGQLDLADTPRPKSPELTELAAFVELRHVPHRARELERHPVRVGEGIERLQGQNRLQTIDRAVTCDRVGVMRRT